jgi:hypothetical protein
MDEPPRGTGRVVLDSSKKRMVTLRRVDEKADCAEYSMKAYIIRGNTVGYVLGEL